MPNKSIVNNKFRGKKVFSVAIIMLLSFGVLTACTQFANARVTQWDTYGFATAIPDTIGVNQPVVVTFQIDKVNPLATIRDNLWQGLTIKVTKPDGTTETKGPMQAYAMSNIYIEYTPTMAGTYTFEGNFPGQWVNGSYTGTNAYGAWLNVTGQPLIHEERYYKPCSAQTTLTVQEEPIQSMPNNPLPTDYWTRPINAENKGWWQIADNWLMQGYNWITFDFCTRCAFAPHTSAPNSAHVLWSKPIIFGGMMGGKFGDQAYYTGLSYEQYYTPIILNGRIIYQEHGPVNSLDIYGTRCLDLYNGEEIWYLKGTAIAFAQTLQFDSGNEHGGLPFLWSTSGSTWKMYDAFTGDYILTIENVTTGVTIFGPNGELLNYAITRTGTNKRMILWNSTLAIVGPPPKDYFSPRVGSVIDGRNGIEWNVSISDQIYQDLMWVDQGYALTSYADSTTYPNIYGYTVYNLNSMKKDSSGNYPTTLNYLWTANRTDNYAALGVRNAGRNPPGSDLVYTFFSEDKLQFHGYSVKTGEELWVTDPLPNGWGIYTYQQQAAYGKLYESGYDGHIRAYDLNDGSLVWDYYFGSAGYENAYGVYPNYNGFTIADGKIYVANDEHSPDSVMWRGGKLFCIDAEKGDCLWNISGWLRHAAISDGILTSLNSLDGKVYTFGKGPSATTVSAPQTAIPKGTTVTITGTVTDQSPGQKSTPAISDADMAAWMEYLHMQKPMPTNAKGVEVTLTAVDPNGNSQTIGTTTSNMAGSYGIMWTPTLEGQYTITATFAGSDSYGGSYDMTYLGVGAAAPVASPTVAPTTEPTVEPTVAPTATASPSPVPNTGAGLGTEVYIAAVAVVVIAVVAAAAVILRKRKKP